MMRRIAGLAVLLIGWTSMGAAQDAIPLPVRKVVLYKNGVGYFEHLGTIKGSQTVEVTLPSSQLNDVLKSLTVLDLGKGQIAGVSYDSAAPLDRRLAELPIRIAPTQGLIAFLNEIRGASVEVRAPNGPVSGKLLAAESRSRSTASGAASETAQLSLYLSSGEVRIVDLDSAGNLRILDPALASDLGRYLDILNTAHERDVRKMQIQTSGSGERQLYLSYTAEAPVWKTTYRVVLDSKQKPLLQGWAIVDNTTALDWLNVTLSLIAGAPVSFVQNLSQPLYARRPIVPVPEGLQVSPQVHDATLQEERKTAAAIRPPAAPAPERSMFKAREEAADAAFAANLEDEVATARRQALQTAVGQARAELFEYTLSRPVTIRRNQSALLPILQADVEGEKVALLNLAGERHPRLAFWLKNTSGLTLNAGSFTVIDSNAFAGEGLLESIQPGESRLLSYAVDLGTEFSTKAGSERQRVEHIQINRGVLRMHAKLLEQKTYVIRNNNDTARTILIEHPVRSGWTLVPPASPVETTANSYRFKLDVKPKSTAEFVVREESPQQTTYSVSSVTPDQIGLWLRERSIDPEVEKALRNIAAKKQEVADLAQKIAALEKEQGEIFRDQERVRGNLQRLGQTPDEAALRQRYVRQLEQQENRLAALQGERNKLESARVAAQQQLDELIQNLAVDKKL